MSLQKSLYSLSSLYRGIMMREFKIIGQLKKTNTQKNRSDWIELMADLLTNSKSSQKNMKHLILLRPIHTGRQRQRLTEGVTESWSWRAVIVTTANHINFLGLHERDWRASMLGYLHKVIWLAEACVGTWKVKKRVSNASEATRRTHSSVRQCLTSLLSK